MLFPDRLNQTQYTKVKLFRKVILYHTGCFPKKEAITVPDINSILNDCKSKEKDIKVKTDALINVTLDGKHMTIESLPQSRKGENEEVGCYGIESQTYEISGSDKTILCEYSLPGELVCNIEGEDGDDVASYIGSYRKQQNQSDGDTMVCSSVYNDYTLLPNEELHDRVPYLRIRLYDPEHY